jgi:hypothetical protein
MLVSLLAELVSGKMICFAMGDRCGCMGVGCEVVKFRGLSVRALRHCVLLACSMQTSGPGFAGRLFDLQRNKDASSTKRDVMEFYGLPPIGQKQRRPMDGAQFGFPVGRQRRWGTSKKQK